MLNGIRNLTERDRLARRIVELENEVARLKAEASRSMMQTNFRAVAREFRLDARVRDIVVDHVVNEMSPIVERSMLNVLKSVQREVARMSPTHPHIAVGAMADYRDFRAEVSIPAITCGVRVGGLY